MTIVLVEVAMKKRQMREIHDRGIHERT